ncbi:MAG: dockerin type I repeat-containing protein [Christensenellaceae bacterium]|nr:dockerin type I repeat-containing protein [Christensenellaceae bacterium]
MKKTLRIIVSVALLVTMLSMTLLPSFAEAVPGDPDDPSTWPFDTVFSEIMIEKFRAFYDQVDESGITNGDKALEFTRTGYGGYAPQWYDSVDMRYMLTLPYFSFCWDWTGQHISGFCNYFLDTTTMRYFSCVFHGSLDLSGSEIRGITIGSPLHAAPTRITSVTLNDCENLTGVVIYGQPYCTEFHGLNTRVDVVNGICLDQCDFRLIELQLGAEREPIIVKTLGNGSVNFVYKYPAINNDDPMYHITAVSKTGEFLGWYSDGQRIETSTAYVGNETEGANLTAVFAGDVDGDGALTVADALTIMRGSLGVVDCPLTMGDIDGSGDLSIADAILLARLLLGVA